MNEINKLIVVRLEEQAGEIALLNDKYAKLKEQATKYRRWWSDEQELTTKLEAQLKDLKATFKVYDAKLEVDDVNNLDGPDDVDVERMQSTADHDPEAMPNEVS